jgi:hypothetical protein
LLFRLSHAGGRHHQPKVVERNGGAIPVWIHEHGRLQDAILKTAPDERLDRIDVALTGGDAVPEAIASFFYEEVVRVIADGCLRAYGAGVECVAIAVRQKKVSPRVGQLPRPRIRGARRVEDPP